MNDVDRLAWALIHFVWQGALVAALYALARQCMARRAGPNARYLLAWSALALMSVAPLLTWIALRPASPASTVHAEVLPTNLSAAPAAAAAGLPAAAEAMGRELVAPALLPWIAALWCAGAMLFWIRLTMGWLRAARLKTTGVAAAPGEWPTRFARLQARLRLSRPVLLVVSARVTAPAVVGWLRPVVLAPAWALTGLAPDQLEAVLLHELAHIRRHDYLINLWQNAVEALLFYHPAVWWVSGHMRTEREFCCDDLAIAGGGHAPGYARALEQLEAARPRNPQPQAELAMAANGGSLLRRIARLLGAADANLPAGRGTAAPLILAGAILLCLCWLLAASGALAQGSPSFDAASIKAHPGPAGPPGLRRAGVQTPQIEPGRLTATGTTTRDLIYAAYGLQPFQLEGGPSWLDTDLYDVAVTTEAPLGRNDLLLRLRALLADRFQLQLRSGPQRMQVYALLAAPGGLKPTPAGLDAGEPKSYQMKLLFIGGQQAAAFLNNGNPGHPVVDHTGAAPDDRFVLTLAADPSCEEIATPCGVRTPRGAELDHLLREQVGMTLDLREEPVTVYTVSHVERPTGN